MKTKYFMVVIGVSFLAAAVVFVWFLSQPYYLLQSFDCGNGRRILIWDCRSCDIARHLYCEVRVSDVTVVPMTKCGLYECSMTPHFGLVQSGNDCFGVLTCGLNNTLSNLPKAGSHLTLYQYALRQRLFAAHNFSTGASYPFNSADSDKFIQTLFPADQSRQTPRYFSQAAVLGAIDGVNIVRSKIADEDLRWLLELPKLRHLDLSYAPITDKGIAIVGHLRTVEYLLLNQLPITNQSIVYISNLANLKELEVISSDRIRGTNLQYLGRLPKLRNLALSSTLVNDSALSGLSALKQLEGLHLGHTRVSDQGMSSVAVLPNLKVLTLNDTEITDAGLIELAKLTGLERH